MAKRNTPPVQEVDEVNESILLLADMLLSDHFFDPESEQTYKQKMSANRPAGSDAMLLGEHTFELPDGVCNVRIEALRTRTHFRVVLSHPDFTASAEGAWSFDNEELTQTKVVRTGDRDTIEAAVEQIIIELEDDGIDEAEFAGFMNGLEDDADEMPLIGDDPAEPPEATSLDRNRMKAIAKRIAKKPDADIGIEDRAWLEQTPQILPAITDALIAAASAAKRDEALVLAYHQLLSLQLEFVRYRQDRGWEWANDMLVAFQRRLIALGQEEIIPRDDWFMMGTALAQARVPVADEVQIALADAGFKPDEVDGPPEEMMRTLRGFMDQMAQMVSSPFEVVDSLQSSGAMLPATLRSFMATEFALSPQAILRDATPLLLLDDDAPVREAAARALEQTAHPDTLSPSSLRRAIAVRNWIPASNRPTLDAAIRKARLDGVEIGAWPAPTPDLEYYASSIDGSGAQSILAASRAGKKGLFVGMLLRYGTGLVDGWVDLDLPRGKINKLLREAQMATPCTRVGKALVDTLVQHAIGTAVEQGAVPPPSLLEIAELIGGTEWKDRRLDVKAEADRMFEALDPADRTPKGIEAGFVRGLEWMTEDDVFATWFEDGPQVQKALAKLPRTSKTEMVALVMTEILPAKRLQWAERFLMLAKLCEAAAESKQRAKARDLVMVAHALASDDPIGAIPIMSVIALQTVRATLLGGW
jgi:hypothetical protein